MTQEQIHFIEDFQENFITPVQNILKGRNDTDPENDELITTIEEILESLSVVAESNGEFKVSYACRGKPCSDFYTLNESVEPVSYSLWEILKYLGLYASNCNVFNDKVNNLKQGIKQLLDIINPLENSEHSN